MKRDNMIIYRSFYEAITELENLEDQAKIWQAIYELGFNGNEHIALTGIQKTIFKLIKPQIEANIKRYQNGKKSKSLKKESNPIQKSIKTEAKKEQNKSKLESNKNNNNNKNKNNNSLEIRKSNFRKNVMEWCKWNEDQQKEYPKEMLIEFFEYWSEHGDNDKKMRYEKEKSFGITRRLATWYKRSGDNYSDPGSDKLVEHVKKQINEKR